MLTDKSSIPMKLTRKYLLLSLLVCTVNPCCISLFAQSEGIQVINIDSARSLKEVLQQKMFRDKLVYIDIWGVHCIPCIEEFDHSDTLKKIFRNQKLAFLYLSLDYGHKDDRDIWLEMIKQKKLDGFHGFLSSDLYMKIWSDLKGSIPKNEMYLIPHYLITDSSGKIVVPDAARPSTGMELYTQITEALRKFGL